MVFHQVVIVEITDIALRLDHGLVPKPKNLEAAETLDCKSMDWFLYDNGLRHERVKRQSHKMAKHTQTIRRQVKFFLKCLLCILPKQSRF